MARQLSEPEQAARDKRGGLTARQYRQKHSKFALPKGRAGEFEIITLIDGANAPQMARFNNEIPALIQFEKLLSNPELRSVKLVEIKTIFLDTGKVVRPETIYQFQRAGNQQYANSKIETLYRRKGGNDVFAMKVIKRSPKLLEAYQNNELEVAKERYVGGEAWWERRQ